MSTQFSWSELKKLVNIDHEINVLRKEIAQHKSEITSASVRLPVLEKKENQLIADRRNLAKDIDRIELTISTLKEKEADKKRKLDAITNPKEYIALEKELAVLERNIIGSESKVVGMMEQGENLDGEISQVQSETATEKERLRDIIASHETAIKESEDKIATLDASWEQQVEAVPAQLAATYKQIRARVSDPVVPIVQNSCSACFYALHTHDIQNKSATAIIRCRGCYRFLFVPEAVTQPEQAEQSA